MGEVKGFIDLLLQTKPIVVISKTYCPYCKMAKNVLNSFPLKKGCMEVVEINNRKDCDEIQNYMEKLTGARTVPRVFIGGNCIGGGQDIQVAKNNGKLEELLKAVNALEC
uniref:Glutaredoxin domain-containing protein n=1 Tax=Syphacia muris TaxID=451379 RepID=A0A0N5ABW2_9BILA